MTRTLQSLPVADAICSPGRQVIFPERVDDELYWGSDLNDALLSRCTRVNFGVAPPQQDIMPVRNEILDGAQIAQRLADHIGPQRLPFDRMWFEGVWPGSVGDVVSGAQEVAVYASTQMKDKDTGEIQKGIGMTPYFLMADGSIARFPVAVRMEADEDGIPEKVRFAPYSDTDSSPEQDRVGLAMVLPTMWAIGLMNCRNVKTTEVTRVAIKTKKMRRARNTSLLSYTPSCCPDSPARMAEVVSPPAGPGCTWCVGISPPTPARPRCSASTPEPSGGLGIWPVIPRPAWSSRTTSSTPPIEMTAAEER